MSLIRGEITSGVGMIKIQKHFIIQASDVRDQTERVTEGLPNGNLQNGHM